jgi:hypothetical protein
MSLRAVVHSFQLMGRFVGVSFSRCIQFESLILHFYQYTLGLEVTRSPLGFISFFGPCLEVSLLSLNKRL